MLWLYSDNGFAFQGVFPDQIAGPGQVILDSGDSDFPTEEQLEDAFPLRLGILIDRARAAKYTVLTNAAQASITGNFSSSALGSPYTYPSLSTDQSNLHTGVLSCPDDSTGWTWNLWCTEDGETWALVGHTFAQLKTALRDYATGLQIFQEHWATVITNLETATDLDSIALVVW